MSILHQISSSLAASNALISAMPFIRDTDGLLLGSEALYGLLNPEIAAELYATNTDIFLLQEDVIALGLAQSLQHHPQISYEKFVQLTLSYDKVISW